MSPKHVFLATAAVASLSAFTAVPSNASSHREAPAITETPKVDGTDLYMFRSYGPGREDFVTFSANYPVSYTHLTLPTKA